LESAKTVQKKEKEKKNIALFSINLSIASSSSQSRLLFQGTVPLLFTRFDFERIMILFCLVLSCVRILFTGFITGEALN